MKMLDKFVIFSCAFVVCLGAGQQAPTPSSPLPAPAEPRVYCSETPNNIFTCLENPHVVKKDVAVKCGKRHLSECDSIKCIFRESGWSIKSSTKDDEINKQTVTEYFDLFAATSPVWSPAVQHLKAACLDKALPAQGATQNCAAFDVLHCIQTSFLRNAPLSQWRNTTDCAYPRSYAASCPICPTSCFATQVPYGTCNACLSLPRTP